MKLDSGDLEKTLPAKSFSLEAVLIQTEQIKETVEEAATDLASVNQVLKQERKANIPVQTLKSAIVQNEKAETQVAKASSDLEQVNIQLNQEVAERIIIDSELTAVKTDLAKANDDLSQSLAKEKEIRQLALQDPLTGLPNRVLFEDRLNYGLSQSKRHGWGLAVLFIDLNKFKSINDSYGHDMGDKILLMVAERLQAFVRDEDMVSRWGGDEFVCVLFNVRQEADLFRIAEKMVNRIAEVYESEGNVFSVRASIGIATCPKDGETVDVLFKNADRAMYKAKATEKGIIMFCESLLDG